MPAPLDIHMTTQEEKHQFLLFYAALVNQGGRGLDNCANIALRMVETCREVFEEQTNDDHYRKSEASPNCS